MALSKTSSQLPLRHIRPYPASGFFKGQFGKCNVVVIVNPDRALMEVKFEVGFRLDLLVEKQVIVEIKSVDGLSEVYFKRVMTYLKLAEKQLGFLINFNVRRLEDKESLIRTITST